MEIPARHPRKGDCIIRERTNTLGRVKVLVDYPDLGVSRRPEYLDELVDCKTSMPIRLQDPPSAMLQMPVAVPQVPSWQDARQALLALRLGQSTAETVRGLSVGLSEVDEACQWALDRAGSGQLSFLLLVSRYGMGKSHALAHLRLRARERSMATGTVVLDGVSTTLCRPLGLISALSHSIEFPEAIASDGLPQRLAGLVRTGTVNRLQTAGAATLFQSLAPLSGDHVDDPDKWETVEDYLSLEVSAAQAGHRLGVHLPPLNANRLVERPGRATDLLHEWAQACTATGARGGLTIVLDEADVDYGNCWRTGSELEQRSALLEAARQMAETGPRGGSYARLVVALAITPGVCEPDPVEELTNTLGRHARTVALRELSEHEMTELGSKVCRLYCQAYEVSEDQAGRMEGLVSDALSTLSRGAELRNPRKFIRLLLEKLDAAYA